MFWQLIFLTNVKEKWPKRKFIYFRKQLDLDPEFVENLWITIKMITKFYVFGFFTSNVGIGAPNTDFLLLKKAANMEDDIVGQLFYKKFKTQLWYLSPELVCLALFDSNVADDTKRKMARKMLGDSKKGESRIVKGNDKFYFYFALTSAQIFISCRPTQEICVCWQT